MKNCPNCKLTNPDSAIRCDCGWDFETDSQKTSYINETREWQLTPWYKRGASLGIKLAGVGVVLGWFTAHPQVDPNGPLVMGFLSEEHFVKSLMAVTGGIILFIIGFVIGSIRINRKSNYGK